MGKNNADVTDMSRYSNHKTVPNPKNNAIKERYFKIYETYVTEHLTYTQLRERFNVSQETIVRAIKYCTFTLKKQSDPKIAQQVLHDKIQLQLQRLEDMLKDEIVIDKKTGKEIAIPRPIGVKLAIIAEIRRNSKLSAQAQSAFLKPNPKGSGDRPINIIMPNTNSGQGVKNAVVIETTAEDVDDD